MLPDKLGDFVVELGADVYAPGALYPYTNTLELSEDFGLGALYNAEDDSITVTLGPRSINITSAFGSVGLYRALDTRSDVLLKSLDFDSTYARQDRSYIFRFTGLNEREHLWVLAQLELPSGLMLNAIAPVTTISDRVPNITPVHTPVTRRRQTGQDPVDGIVQDVIVVREKELLDALHLDFSVDAPVRYGAGTLTYAGGGNRYLVGFSGPVWQDQDQAPWLGQAWPLLEPAGGNNVDDYMLAADSFTVTGSAEVVSSDLNLDGFTERFLQFHIQQQPTLNGVWELAFTPTAWDGTALTGSMFLQATTGTHRVRLGLRTTNTTGTTETWSDNLDVTELSVVGVSKAGPVEAAGTVSLVVRISDLNPGDFVELTCGFPQVEYGAGVHSRSTGIRAADNLVFTPGYALEGSYGRFDIVLVPSYRGIPNEVGAQLFFDSRDSNGLNGFWLGHRTDGLLEFGMAGSTGTVHVRSASAIQLSDSKPVRISCFFDVTSKNMRVDVDGVVAVEKTLSTIVSPSSWNSIRFGSRYNSEHYGNFVLHEFKHQQTPE